jgi:hypothetical protein
LLEERRRELIVPCALADQEQAAGSAAAAIEIGGLPYRYDDASLDGLF